MTLRRDRSMAPGWEATFRARRLIAGAIVAVVAAAISYCVIPRRADLARFDPKAMAGLETSMWRHYYEKRYVALFLDLYRAARRQRAFRRSTACTSR
jgi:hypothetical protein